MIRRSPRFVAALAATLGVLLLVLLAPGGGSGPLDPTASPSSPTDGSPVVSGVESNPGVVVVGRDSDGAIVAEIIVAVRNVGSAPVLLDPLRSTFELTDARGVVVGEGRFLFAGPTLLAANERGYLMGWARVRTAPTGGAARNVAFADGTAASPPTTSGSTIGARPLTVTTTLSGPGIAVALCYDAAGAFVGAVGGEGSGRLALTLPDFVPATAPARCELFAGPAPAR